MRTCCRALTPAGPSLVLAFLVLVEQEDLHGMNVTSTNPWKASRLQHVLVKRPREDISQSSNGREWFWFCTEEYDTPVCLAADACPPAGPQARTTVHLLTDTCINAHCSHGTQKVFASLSSAQKT